MLNWDQDVRPVLLAIHHAIESHPSDNVASEHLDPLTDSATINTVLGRDEVDGAIYPVLLTLKEYGYLGRQAYGNPSTGEWEFVQLNEKGLQVAAGWPTRPGDDVYEALIAVVDRLIADAATPDDRTRLEKLRDGVAGVGRDVLTDVLSKVATEAM